MNEVLFKQLSKFMEYAKNNPQDFQETNHVRDIGIFKRDVPLVYQKVSPLPLKDMENSAISIFLGGHGTGKTYRAFSNMRWCFDNNKSYKYITFYELYRKCFDDKEYVQRLFHPWLVVVDEITGLRNNLSDSIISELVNERWQNNKNTILIANSLSLEDLVKNIPSSISDRARNSIKTFLGKSRR